jgi:hypothetical protein
VVFVIVLLRFRRLLVGGLERAFRRAVGIDVFAVVLGDDDGRRLARDVEQALGDACRDRARAQVAIEFGWWTFDWRSRLRPVVDRCRDLNAAVGAGQEYRESAAVPADQTGFGILDLPHRSSPPHTERCP